MTQKTHTHKHIQQTQLNNKLHINTKLNNIKTKQYIYKKYIKTQKKTQTKQNNTQTTNKNKQTTKTKTKQTTKN